MTPAEEARVATLQFYQALDDLLLNKGVQAMCDVWLHDWCVSTVHPFGHWARGWDEVLASWQEVGALFSYYRGHADRKDGIGGVHDLKIVMLGEAAFATGVYKSTIYMPGGPMLLSVNCTNVLLQRDGVWKMIHHHPDQAPPDYQAALASMVQAPKT
jgi:ketosteroid isomerase-like protein